MATPAESTEPHHVCFICLETSADAPNGSWVKPCPCSLEAHEPCMLRWVAESESTATVSKPGSLQCPACRAPIYIDEPFDPVVAVYNAWHRTYDRAAPNVVGAIISSGAVVGSAWYGWKAATVFAGHRTAYQWFAINTLKNLQRTGPAWYAVASSLFRMSELALIGPSLVILSLLPATLSSVVPVSVVYAGTLLSRGRGLRWPPSPQWVATLIPTAYIVHRTLYREFIKPIERRLNLALMGRPPVEDAQPDQDEAGAGQEDFDPGLIALVLYISRFVYTILGFNAPNNRPNAENGQQEGGELPPPAGIEVEIRFGAAPAEGDQAEPAAGNEGIPAEANQNGPQNFRIQQIQAVQVDPVPQAAQPAQPAQPAPEPLQAAARPPAPAAAPRQNRRPRPRRPRPAGQAPPRPPPARAAEAEEAYRALWNWIVTRTSTALLLPGIAYGMGEVIRRVVPLSWTRRPALGMPATGLLQMRWGRSLVGAYLFFVARNVFTFAYKYHKVLAKRSRRIRSFKKEGQGQGQDQARQAVGDA